MTAQVLTELQTAIGDPKTQQRDVPSPNPELS